MSHALILTDGKPGHENQSKALAEGLGCSFDLVPCTYPTKGRKTLSYLCDRVGLRPDLTGVLPAARAAAANRRPDLIIGAGSNTFYSLKIDETLCSKTCYIVKFKILIFIPL